MRESKRSRRPDTESLLQHRGFIQALARKLVWDKDAADDVVQETLLAAMRNPPEKEGALRGWLAKVVRNLAYRTLRDRERRRRREKRGARPEAGPSTSEVVARLAWHRKVVDTVLQLDEPSRTTLLLRFYDDLQPKEIAERTGVPAATVRTRLKRGLDRMRERLDADHDGNRRAWCLALLPLAYAVKGATTGGGAIATGALLMSAKKKAAAVVALFLLAVVTTTLVATSGFEEQKPTPRSDVAKHAPVAAEVSDAPDETSASVAERRSLTVLVKDTAGRPVAGASVSILRTVRQRMDGPWIPNDWSRVRFLERAKAPTVIAGVTTGDAGEALFTELPDGDIDLAVSREGYATAREFLWQLPKEPVTITLAPPHRLEGRVLDDEGDPVAGAVVLAGHARWAMTMASGPRPHRVVADREGKYAFPVLEAHDLALWAAFPGGTPWLIGTLRFPDVGRFDIVLERGGTLQGTITDQATGKPLPGVEVAVFERSTQPLFSGHAVTDARGRYEIATMPPGVLRNVTLRKQGYAQVFRPWQEVPSIPLRRGETAVLDGEMHVGGVVSGVVLGPDGPAAGAAVATWAQRPDHAGVLITNTIADDQGRFRLEGLAATRHFLGARHGGLFSYEMFAPWVAMKEAPADAPYVADLKPGLEVERELRLVAGKAVVEGVVEGPDGRPFEGAKVSAGGASTTSAADGSFRLEHVKASPLTYLHATAKGYEFAAESVRLEAASEVRDIRLRLREAREQFIRGRVTAEDGSPLPEAWVLCAPDLQAQGNDYWERQQEIRRWYEASRVWVDSEGRYEIRIGDRRVNRYFLRAEAPGLAPSVPRTVAIVEDQTAYAADFALGTGHTLAGRVTGPPGTQIRVQRERRRDALNPVYGPDDAVAAVVAADGSFHVDRLEEGKWEVVASAPGHANANETIVLPQKSDLHLELRPLTSIAGRVVFEDGAPAVGAKVYAWKRHDDGSYVYGQGVNYGATTDAKGRFRIDQLRPGRFELKVQGDEKVSLVRWSDDDVWGGTRDLEVVVRRGLSIEGRVVDADGNGVGEVYLTATKEDGKGTRHLYGSARSRTDGSFEIPCLPPGVLTVRASKDQKDADLGEVDAGARDLRVVFDSGRADLGRRDIRAIGGVLVDESGVPVLGREIRAIYVKAGGPYGKWSRTDHKGRFSFQGLNEGRYALYLKRSRDPEARQYVAALGEVVAGTTGITLTARNGLAVRGKVTDESGRPLSAVKVYAKLPGLLRETALVKSGRGGEFAITGVDGDQTCTLVAVHPALVTEVKHGVPAGSEDVALVLLPGLETSGILRDVDGRPIAGASLFFMAQKERLCTARATTDSEGRFRVPLKRGLHDVSIHAGGTSRGQLRIRAGDTSAVLRLAKN